MTETGAIGNRLRSLALGPEFFFGGATGTSMTLAGDGTELRAVVTDAEGAMLTVDWPLAASD